MIKDNILLLLNDQIELEAFSSVNYMAMSAWLDSEGYSGAAKFMVNQAQEEWQHMWRVFNYITEANGRAIVPAIPKPQEEFDSFQNIFKMALEHEQKVTAAVHNIVFESQSSRDFTTFNFMQWYVSEQLEEEAVFSGILDKIAMLEKEGGGFYLLDRELAGMSSGPNPAGPE